MVQRRLDDLQSPRTESTAAMFTIAGRDALIVKLSEEVARLRSKNAALVAELEGIKRGRGRPLKIEEEPGKCECGHRALGHYAGINGNHEGSCMRALCACKRYKTANG
jgi:hypothetical protein